VSWIWFIFAGIIFAFTRLGLVPSTPVTEDFTQVGIIWMVAVWSLALADRVNILKVEAEVSSRKLIESESRYRRLVEIMNEGLGMSDENDIYTYVNPRLAEMLGFSTDEMIGHPVVEFFDEESRSIITDQFARRRLGEEQPYTITWRCKDGNELHTLIAPAAVFDPEGKFQRSIAVVTDISEQVEASQLLEQRVAERTHELSTLLDVSKVIVGTLELELLLKVILEELRLVIDFDGAAIISLGDRTLTSLNFPLKIKDETDTRFIRAISASLNTSERFRRDEAIIIADVQADTAEGNDFRAIASTLIDVDSVDMRAWMGIPLKVKEKLVGVLSVHHRQPNYYTPAMAHLAQAFANQAAVAIENARLYRQAQAAAAAKERGRLARELHDSVTQALYSLTLYAEATRLALGNGKAEAAVKNLQEVLSIAREGMGDLRLLIFELRPPILEEEGFVGALQARLEAVEARAGCQAEFHVQGEPHLSPEVESELYWTVHEALNNVLKHARAKHVYVDLQFHNGASKITIMDDGVGFDASNLEQVSGIGIKNITERINRIGGSFKIESQNGKGTFFEVKLAPGE
ncbi:MAG: PAS domain S-box protein, partial [Anaerolineales bacterium]